MKVTKEFLRDKHACATGYKWFCENCLELVDFEDQIKHLSKHRFDWTNWLLVRLMSLEQKRKYAIFAAEKVLDIFEAKYPTDKRPRKAIEAAEAVLKNNTKENRAKADAAADDAYTAYDDAYDDADDATYTVVADAASSAAAASAVASSATSAAAYAYADAAAVSAASAAASAADTSAYAYAYADDAAAAADAAGAADSTIKETIINYGLELIIKELKDESNRI